MNIRTLCLILFAIILSPQLFSQEEPAYDDTSYFSPFDQDYNLVMSASRGHLNNVRLLLKRGANVNATTPEGVTSLMYAADNGDLPMVRLLITNGANPDLQPQNGISALMSAAIGNHFDVAEYLLKHGADPNLRDEDGITALNYAAAYNYPEMTDMLLFFGAKPEIADKHGNTPLISAVYNNSLEAAEILLARGANINASDNNGFTPLMVSIQQQNGKLTDMLLEQGADIHKANRAGLTALAFAVEASDENLVEKLIEMGADVNHKISGSRNILELARRQKDKDIAALLIAEGAKPNHYPGFNQVIIGPSVNFNSDDFMTSVDVGIYDTKYHFSLEGGFAFRPVAVKTLVKVSDELSYQYWERRYCFHLGVGKNFEILKLKTGYTSGPRLALSETYSFGGYRGSSSNPGPAFITVPEAGWYFANKWMNIILDYRILNLDTEYINPGRISLGMHITLPLRKKKTYEKEIRWLTN